MRKWLAEHWGYLVLMVGVLVLVFDCSSRFAR